MSENGSQYGSSPGQQPSGMNPQKDEKPSAWRRFASVVSSTGIFHPDEWPVKALLRTAVALCVLVFALSIMRQGFAHVRETEVGVLANNLTGELILKDRVGYHFFIPYFGNFYRLDKTIQKLNLTWDQGSGGAPGKDVKLKTADGNNVSLDITVNFKLMPEKAADVLRDSGMDMRFAETWMEPFARHACFSCFGRLTTEQLYDATKRDEMAQAASKQLNEVLNPHGIQIIAVIPGQFRFYKDYEQVIQEKKLADQQVQEQQAQARADLEDQERQLVEVRKRAETRLITFEGESTNRMIQAEAEAAKTRRDAEGQSRYTKLAADGQLYTTTQEATGRKATMLAEAQGMEELRKAMAGDGGVQMVGLEYAKRLDHIRFTGTAITKQPSVQQISVQPGEVGAAMSFPGGPR